jgi:hypothetical protein
MEGAGPGRAGGAELMAGLRGGARGAQPARDVEDAGETLLSFYDLDTDRDLEAGDVGAGHQAPRVCTRPGCLTLDSRSKRPLPRVLRLKRPLEIKQPA